MYLVQILDQIQLIFLDFFA